MSGAGVPRGLRPLPKVRDEMGVDRLTAELAAGQIASTVVITSPPSKTITCPIGSPYATGPLIEVGISNFSLTDGRLPLGSTRAMSLSETGCIVPPDWI